MPGPSTSTSTTPVGESSAPTRPRSSRGAPPIPMLPSSSSALPQVPAPGRRSKIEPSMTFAPRVRAMRTASGDMSTPTATMPRRLSATTWASGAAADVEYRAAGPCEDAMSRPPSAARGTDAVRTEARRRARQRPAVRSHPEAAMPRAAVARAVEIDHRHAARGRALKPPPALLASGRSPRQSAGETAGRRLPGDGQRVRVAIHVAPTRAGCPF